jgi:uroporphyrinogen-III synthase
LGAPQAVAACSTEDGKFQDHRHVIVGLTVQQGIRETAVAAKGFEGRRVLSLESRRSTELARLIETYGGIPLSAPAMREVPLKENEEALHFASDLNAGRIDLVIFLTGTGARTLLKTIAEVHGTEDFLQALRKVKVAARGPKPQAVLREWSVPVAVVAPEPCTWRELLHSLEGMPGGLSGKRVAVQEYGAPNSDFLEALNERGANVRAVSVYQWALPEDRAPLRDAISSTIEGKVDAALFTTGIQVAHLFQIADEMGRRDVLRTAFNKVLVASIGPSTSETLRSAGIRVDLEASHPKMGLLVKEAAERLAEFLAFKTKD